MANLTLDKVFQGSLCTCIWYGRPGKFRFSAGNYITISEMLRQHKAYKDSINNNTKIEILEIIPARWDLIIQYLQQEKLIDDNGTIKI